MIFGPAAPIPESDRYRIDQFLMSGKSVLVFVNAWDVALWNIDENLDFTGSRTKPDSHIESRGIGIDRIDIEIIEFCSSCGYLRLRRIRA